MPRNNQNKWQSIMTSKASSKRVDIWHNILWSKYKGEVFSALYNINNIDEFDINFIQISETHSQRIGLSAIDLTRHRYPYKLLFKGSLENINVFARILTIFNYTFRSNAELTILTGYERIEYWFQLILLRIMGKKVAVFCDSTIFDNKQKLIRGILKRIFFSSVNGIFCYGQRSKEYVIHYGADPQKVFHRCQAAALPTGYSVENAMANRISMAPSPAEPRYLYVGRLSPEKDLDKLINAFSEVREKNARATLIIVGNGPQRPSLETQCNILGLFGAIEFKGSKDSTDLFQEYSKATCLILPSRSEPWGLVVNEALSFGCPAIVSNHCGCLPELVIEGKTGFSHEVGNVEDLAKKMIDAPDHFSDVERIARNCLELISSYKPTDAASQILNGIRNIFSTSGKKNE